MGVKQKQLAVHTKHPKINYKTTGYRNIAHARGCSHAVKQKQLAVHTKHPKINYKTTGYRNIAHARGCSHAQTAITHHSISDKEMFFSILASGLSILAALVSIGIGL